MFLVKMNFCSRRFPCYTANMLNTNSLFSMLMRRQLWRVGGEAS